jgi:predicted outer membrane repeat protein
MRKNLRRFVNLSVTGFLSMFFVFALIPKLFAQVNVDSFTYLSSLLADGAQSGLTIQISTPTIISTANYNGCGQTKTIIGMTDVTDGSVLDGNGHFGIYGSGNGQNIYLNSITMCNFQNSTDTAPSWDQKNGTALFFQNGANVYLNGNINITSNTISGGGGDFASNGGDCAGICINMSDLFTSSGTINFIYNRSLDVSGSALYFNGSNLNFYNNTVLFQDNEAGDEGAALWAWENANLYFINSSVNFFGKQSRSGFTEN